MKLTLSIISVVTTLSISLVANPHAIEVPKELLRPFLDKHCVQCHGPKKQKGDIRFDRDNWVIDNNDSAQRWQDVLDQLNAGDMPPEEEEQPTNKEMTGILRALTGSVNEAKRRLTDHGGEIKMRRLNKREYSNTMKALFGFSINPSHIPGDGEITTFDTVGDEQFFTSIHFDRYLELARSVTKQAIHLNTRPYAKMGSTRVEPEKRVTDRMRKDLAGKDRKMALKKAGKGWKEMGFKDEGDAKILFSQWKHRAEIPRAYLKYPKVDTGVYNSDAAKWLSVSKHVDVRGEYELRIHGGIEGDPPEIRKNIRLWNNRRIYGTLKMSGTPDKPETVSMRVRQNNDETAIHLNVRENQPDNTINSMRGYLKRLGIDQKDMDPRPAIWVDWLEIKGPFYPERRPLFEKMLYPDAKTGGRTDYIDNKAYERKFIEKFATIAFRNNKPDPSFIDALEQDFKSNIAAGMKRKDAFAEVMAIILSSPSFLFIQEAVPAQEKPHGDLSNGELAVRLSYFLWSGPPDAELYAANLLDPKVYNAQLDRLISDPRSKAFRDGFIGQWAEFDRYDAITIDTKNHYLFNQGLQQDAKREVQEYFRALLDRNLPVSYMIDSNVVSVNGALAAHYGIPGVNPKDGSFQLVKLPKDSVRGGLLTQTAFLIAGSNGERSSPVIRGAMVLEKILHNKPEPPPPNVPELDAASSKPLSNREMVLAHQQRASCASCHKVMDVIGFGLENFDTTGRWRTTEKVGKKEVAIQTGGLLPRGTEFTDVRQLKKILKKYDYKLAKELVSSVLSYGLGRTIEFSDTDDVDGILAKLKPKKYRTGDIIREVAKSELFKRK